VAAYRLELRGSAERDLKDVPPSIAGRISLRIDRLEEEPRGFGTEKLGGSDEYRARVGDYRVIYLIDDRRRVVEIVRVRHRREVYRRLR